jgi:hypothetical protein
MPRRGNGKPLRQIVLVDIRISDVRAIVSDTP